MATKVDIRKKAHELRGAVVSVYSVVATPVVAAAASLGYTVLEFEPTEETRNVSGAVDHAARRIHVNATEAATRKRFTIAHELGHIVLHGDDEDPVDYRADIQYGRSQQPKEREATAFAAELLMPQPVFESLWNAYRGDVAEVAGALQVSPDAARIRAEQLRLT